MSNTRLFPDVPAAPEASPTTADPVSARPEPTGRPRLLEPDRHSVQLMTSNLDSLLPSDHNARAAWAYVQRMDHSPLLGVVRARGSHPGRPAIDPALLMAVWLFATLAAEGRAPAGGRGPGASPRRGAAAHGGGGRKTPQTRQEGSDEAESHPFGRRKQCRPPPVREPRARRECRPPTPRQGS